MADGIPVRVATDVDRESFERLLFETVTGVPRTTEGLWEPSAVITFDGETCRYEGPDPLGTELDVRLGNTSDQPGLGVVFGTYGSEATAEVIQAMIDGGFSEPPSFFSIQSLAPLPANTTGYATATGISAKTTIWCAVSEDIIELAGPKLRTG